ncbi:MAG: M1 family metallopeptidase [Phycisphaeraceae bacterium]|nr:MAG: M1 family metallopeptidase [Phycisphaeraceae bacterium]
MRTPNAGMLNAALILAVLAGHAAPAPAHGRGGLGVDHGHECASCLALRARFDPATGRDTRNFARDTGVDHRHMKLELFIADMNDPVMRGVQTLTVMPLTRPARELTLDARLLSISRVTVDGHITRFDHDGERLRLYFDPPLPVGEDSRIVTTYEVRDPPRGLFWTPESPAWPGRAAQVHTQGQPETNSYWFPCHDFPNDRLTTEVVVTVPEGYTASSNGRLVRVDGVIEEVATPTGTGLAGYTRYHWDQGKPHVNYLVSLVVGKFDVVDLGGPSLPMPVYAPQGRGTDVRNTFGRTPEMVRVFERLLDEPYPWDRYAQLVVWNFAAGGMENTSATTLHDNSMIGPEAVLDYDLEGLISHELAHQWFGDLVTCTTWEHIWLNEGWATFMTPLWLEHRDGRGAYDLAVHGLFRSVIASDTGALPETPGMASKVYGDPWETFRRSANPYPKGASVLHMLRQKLGDRAFFAGTALYLDRHKLGNVETSDFRKALEDASGESLEQFFSQWFFRPNVPRVTVGAAYDEAAGVLTLSASQTQAVDAHNPAFEFDLPVWVRSGGGTPGEHSAVLRFEGRTATATIPMASAPSAMAFDPGLTVLCEVSCDHPAARSRELARHAPTLVARVRGVAALGGDTAEKTLMLLKDTALDRTLDPALRVAAVRALGESKSWIDTAALATSGVEPWSVRETIASVIGSLAGPGSAEAGVDRSRALELLERSFENDPSTKVRAAAVRAMGAMNAGAALPIILKAAQTDSQNDDLRSAAVAALASLDRKACVDPVIALTRAGVNSRTRPEAVRALAGLAKHDDTKVFETIAPLVEDREWRTRCAAHDALVDLADPRGEAVLRRRAESARDPYERALATERLDALRARLSPR